MTKSYREHHIKAMDLYKKQEPEKSGKGRPLNKCPLDVVKPDGNSELLSLPDNYMDLVSNIAKQANDRFNDKKHCFFPPNLNKNEDVSLRLNQNAALEIKEVEQLAEYLLPQLEENLYSSYLHVDKCYFYRNFVTKNKERTSWLWHYDNHPTEIYKVMIYLTDVGEKTAPFEYLATPDGEPKMIEPSRQGILKWGGPKWPRSRVPADVMQKFLDKGYKKTKVTGPQGTILVFDNNCIHKANVARTALRDVLVYQIRPAHMKMRPYISPKWTGGFEANDIVKDPSIIKPTGKFAK